MAEITIIFLEYQLFQWSTESMGGALNLLVEYQLYWPGTVTLDTNINRKQKQDDHCCSSSERRTS